MKRRIDRYQGLVFPSALGWMGVILSGNRIRQLTFGHASRKDACEHLDSRCRISSRPQNPRSRLVRRLRAYARGEVEGFHDVLVDLEGYTAFQRRVFRACRQIARGITRSYGELAAQVGSPRAARAVGNCMAQNRIPLIIPCHRVVSFSGQIGFYSAPGGKRMKKRLLDLEKNAPQ